MSLAEEQEDRHYGDHEADPDACEVCSQGYDGCDGSEMCASCDLQHVDAQCTACTRILPCCAMCLDADRLDRESRLRGEGLDAVAEAVAYARGVLDRIQPTSPILAEALGRLDASVARAESVLARERTIARPWTLRSAKREVA